MQVIIIIGVSYFLLINIIYYDAVFLCVLSVNMLSSTISHMTAMVQQSGLNPYRPPSQQLYTDSDREYCY